MLLATTFVAAYRLVGEGSARRMVTNLFGMHVSPAIVTEILKQDDPREALALHGKRVKATIFYSDIRGFTAMCETMTPEEIYEQLNEYFEEMCAIVFEHGGYVDKFIGDCVMAVFSAPYQTPDDARNAVIAAVEQQARIAQLCARWRSEGKREFTVGMGINTGDVVMGNLGASSRMNYTVIGDNVNVAARLYNVAKAGEIVISESTYAECRDAVEVEELEPVVVKGKSLPIAIYNVTALKPRESGPCEAALLLFALAFFASVFGAMVGLGGGFILVPALRLFFGLAPAEAAGTSLVLIVASSASGAVAYLLQRRVHLKIGLLLAAGGLPGGVIGAMLSLHIAPRLFDWILAVLLFSVAVDMAWNARKAHARPSRTPARARNQRHVVSRGVAAGLSHRHLLESVRIWAAE